MKLLVIGRNEALLQPLIVDQKGRRSPRRLRLLVMTIKGVAPRDDAPFVIARGAATW